MLEVRDCVVILVIARVAFVQFMVATRDHIDVLVLEDIESVFALWVAGIVKTVALDAIPGVDQE